VCALSASVAAVEPTEEQIKSAGKAFKAGCFRCHPIPDASVAGDRVWIASIKRGKCGRMGAQTRAALVRWIESRKKRELAVLIDKPPREKSVKTWIEPRFESGSVVLAKGSREHRLVWAPGGADQRRYLRSGTYRIRRITIDAKGDDADYTLAWARSDIKQTVKVASKGGTKIGLTFAPQILGWARMDRGRVRMGATLATQVGDGISVFRGTTRLAVIYSILDASGKLLKAGKLKHAEEGNSWAYVGLPSGGVRVAFEIKSGPFVLKPTTVEVKDLG